jgi:AcrR family transcriptional regulator
MTDTKDITVDQDFVALIDHGQVDGRTMRRSRNRSAVINALLELIHEGDFEPGAAAIAERAGVSHRSVFRYFDDLADLVKTAVEQEFEQAEQLANVERLGQGTVGERIERFVLSRIALWRFVDAAAILAQIKRLSIPDIDASFVKILESFREQVEVHFDAELSRAGASRRPHAVDAILVTTSHDAYSYHRRLFRHDDAAICSSWSGGINMLLSA